MRVSNHHGRDIPGTAAEAGAILDSLSSEKDRLWPTEMWPRMRLSERLRVGSAGGHGPIRYSVVEYDPGRRVRFRFSAPAGFEGFHEYRIGDDGRGGQRLLHILEMVTSGPAVVSWPMIYRPMHDALIEDSLAKAARDLGADAPGPRWSAWVRLLRSILKK